jgi:hypothetical protein
MSHANLNKKFEFFFHSITRLSYYRYWCFAAGGAAGDGEGAGVEQPRPALQARVPVRLLEIVFSLRISTTQGASVFKTWSTAGVMSRCRVYRRTYLYSGASYPPENGGAGKKGHPGCRVRKFSILTQKLFFWEAFKIRHRTGTDLRRQL